MITTTYENNDVQHLPAEQMSFCQIQTPPNATYFKYLTKIGPSRAAFSLTFDTPVLGVVKDNYSPPHYRITLLPDGEGAAALTKLGESWKKLVSREGGQITKNIVSPAGICEIDIDFEGPAMSKIYGPPTSIKLLNYLGVEQAPPPEYSRLSNKQAEDIFLPGILVKKINFILITWKGRTSKRYGCNLRAREIILQNPGPCMIYDSVAKASE